MLSSVTVALRLRSEYSDFAPTGIPLYAGGMLQGYLGAPVTVHGANGYSVSGAGDFPIPSAVSHTYATSTDRDSVYAQSDYRIRRHLLVLGGFQYEDERGYSGAPANSIERRNSSYTLLFQGDIKGRLFYTLGTGVEDNELFGVVPTPRASLAYLLKQPNPSGVSGGTRLRASFGRGIKEPASLNKRTRSKSAGRASPRQSARCAVSRRSDRARVVAHV